MKTENLKQQELTLEEINPSQAMHQEAKHHQPGETLKEELNLREQEMDKEELTKTDLPDKTTEHQDPLMEESQMKSQ